MIKNRFFLSLILLIKFNNIISMQPNDSDNNNFNDLTYNEFEEKSLEQNSAFLDLPEEILQHIIGKLVNTYKVDNIIKKIKNTKNIFELYFLDITNYKNILMNLKREAIKDLSNVLKASWRLRHSAKYYINKLIKNYLNKLENTFKDKEQEFIEKIKKQYSDYSQNKLDNELKNILNSNSNIFGDKIKSDLKKVTKLVLAGADINLQNQYGETALIWIVKTGYKNIIKIFLNQKNVDVNLQNDCGQNALIWAIRKGYKYITELLLNYENINVNLSDVNGKTALMWAVMRNNKYIVKLLLNNKNINFKLEDKTGKTALMLAIEKGYKDIAKLIN